MKKSVIVILITVLGVLQSCDENVSSFLYEESWGSAKANIIYTPPSSGSYGIFYNNKPFTSGSIILIGNELEEPKVLSAWLKITSTSTDSTQVMHKEIKLERGHTYNFIRLSETSDMDFFEYPTMPTVNTIMRTQLFYDNANQPETVKVTVLAVDRYQFLVTAQSNFNSPNLTLKTEVAHFTLNRNKLSEYFDLNLKQFNGGTNNFEAQFYYKIENAATGAIIQDYNKNVKINVDAKGTSSTDKFLAKHKYTLSKFGTSGTYPFNTPGILINQAW